MNRKTTFSGIVATAKANKLIIGLAIVVILVSFAGAWKLSSSKNSAATVKCPVQVCISISAQNKQPTEYTIKSGSYIQFNNADGKIHEIELIHSGIQHKDPSRYSSGPIKAGEAWKVQFKQDGTYIFVDKYNPDVEMSVIVYTQGKDYKIQ